MQYRLSTLFWAILVFATSMSLAGIVLIPLAVIVGFPCALYWLALLWLLPRRRDRNSGTFLMFEGLIVLGIVVFFAVVAPAIMPRAREAARRSQCANNLKQIGLALDNYRDKWKCLPSAITADASGKPLHSWRTLILPFVEQQAVYSKCDLKAAWNEGGNASLLGERLPVYSCPSDLVSEPPAIVATSDYFAVVGPGTAWDPKAQSPPPSPPPSPPKKTSGNAASSPGNTRITVVEVSHSGIAWAEPKDFTLDEVLAAAEQEDPKTALPRSEHPGQFIVLLADGSVRTLSNRLPRDVLKTLFTQGFTPEAARAIDTVDSERSEEHQRRWERKVRLLWGAFAAWLASVIGFGVHAFRVCRSPRTQAAEATTAVTTPPSDGPPSQDAGN